MKELEILEQYNNGLPLDLIARKVNCSLHFVLKVIHFNLVGKKKELIKCKRIVDDYNL